jgi:hypothetical protein
MPDDAGPSSGAAANTPPASEATPRGSAASAPPRGPAASAPPIASAPSTSATGAPATGFWSYVTAGANAFVERDANVPPLAHFAGGGCHEESQEVNLMLSVILHKHWC